MSLANKNIIIESQYFPCVQAMKIMVESQQLLIEHWEHYCKMSFRNRSIIVGSNGLINLSIPLKEGRGQRYRISQVKIDNAVKWQDQHWRSIESCYAKAPFFDYFKMKFQHYYLQPYEYLFEFNLAILKTLFTVFNSNTTLSLTESYHKEIDTYQDFRNIFLPKNYTTLNSKEIRYTQVFEGKTGFLPNLSIIDFICCEGVKL